MLHANVLRDTLIAAVLGLTITAGPTLAQVQAPPSSTRTPAAPAERPRAVEKSSTSTLEGSVKKVDPATQQVRVSSGLFGMLGRTLDVNTDTQIQMDGRQAKLADIQQGSKVRASYEDRDGKHVATRIEVLPSHGTERGTSGGTSGKRY